MLNEESFERITSPIPGPRTRELGQTLRRVESRNVTFVGEDFPVFWESASGATVTDVDSNRYIDLTAAFGVANTGHSNPRVAEAIHAQATRLMHAMGDVHPTAVKTRLLETLARITPGDLQKSFLASTGAEAIEAAMKTAVLATGKTGFAAFRNAYHGLSLGALTICGIERFSAPFASALRSDTLAFDFPRSDNAAQGIADALKRHGNIAALFVEPIQGRGGCVIPPPSFLRDLREICTELRVLLVFDEIYTGFGRTGAWFACDHDGVVPDILCLGKALGNGFPISAAVASQQVMDAWPVSAGEALHTSTYLGNPMACAAALANIEELRRLDLPAAARALGALLQKRLENFRAKDCVRDVRGRGLMWAIELRSDADAARAVKNALRRGVVLIQAGAQGNVLSITPPLVISQAQLFRAVDVIEELL